MGRLRNHGKFPDRPIGLVFDSLTADGRNIGNIFHNEDGTATAFAARGGTHEALSVADAAAWLRSRYASGRGWREGEGA